MSADTASPRFSDTPTLPGEIGQQSSQAAFGQIQGCGSLLLSKAMIIWYVGVFVKEFLFMFIYLWLLFL
jgi:hypothetical protein